MTYWNDLWPGYDAPRGLPCCKTNERGYPCGCKEPAPIPEGVRKADPYVPPMQTVTAPTVDEDDVIRRIDVRSKYPYEMSQADPLLEDEFGEGPGLHIPRPRLLAHIRQQTPRKREALCAFEFDGGIYGGIFKAQPMRPFKPLGLMIWGAPPNATMEAAYVGNLTQLIVSMGKFPAAWFSRSQSFEQIFELLKEGKVPPSFGDWDTCEVGCMIRVIIESVSGAKLGPQDGVQLGMWGYSVSP